MTSKSAGGPDSRILRPSLKSSPLAVSSSNEPNAIRSAGCVSSNMASLHVGLGYHCQKGSNENFSSEGRASYSTEKATVTTAYFCEVFSIPVGLISPAILRTLLGQTSSG